MPNRRFDNTLVVEAYVEFFGTTYLEAYEREAFNLNKVDEFGNTMMHIAAQNGNDKISSLLIEKGANPNHQNKQGQTPGHYGEAYKFFDFVSWLYDPDKGETRSMRSKEEAHDYRYFPDPDLLPLEIEQDWVDNIAANLPELPDEKKARFLDDFGLSEYDASVLTAEVESADFFEAVAKGRDGKLAANWVINELFGRLKKDEK